MRKEIRWKFNATMLKSLTTEDKMYIICNEMVFFYHYCHLLIMVGGCKYKINWFDREEALKPLDVVISEGREYEENDNEECSK